MRLGDLVAMPLPEAWGDSTITVPPGTPAAIVPAVGPDGQPYPAFPPSPAYGNAPAYAPGYGSQATQPIGPGSTYPAYSRDGQLFLAYAPSPQYPRGVAFPAAFRQDGVIYPIGNAAGPTHDLYGNSLLIPIPVTVPIPASSLGPGGAWQRAPILPDSILPPALQRSNPLVRTYVYRPNQWDQVLKNESALWGWVRTHGGLKSCCRVPELGAPIYNDPPWMVMPSQGEKFEQMFSQPLSAFQDSGGAFTGLDVLLGRFVVPNGYDGAINRVVAQFAGTGFVDFSGSIIWRVKVNARYARTLGNIKNTFGDFATAFSVPGSDNIRLVSQQTISLYANIPTGSPVGGNSPVMAGAFGWFYPRR